MNIFESYLKEIFSLIKKNKKKLDLKSINDFKGVNLEIPPLNIDSDLSSNLCMILAKVNKMDPKRLALKIKVLIKKRVKDFKEVEIAGPGFINIKLKLCNCLDCTLTI